MLDLNRLACDASRLCCADDGAKSFFGMVVHTNFVLGWRVLDHLRIGRKRMKRLQDCERGDFGTDSLGQGDTVLDGLPSEFRAVHIIDHEISYRRRDVRINMWEPTSIS